MKDKTYQTYVNYKVSEVPLETMQYLINLFVNYAAINLGASPDKANVDRIIEQVQGHEFNFLPVSVVASAFMRGSLGKLKNDKTTLSPRNIFEWLTEVSIEYKQGVEHDKRDRELSNTEKTFDLYKYPVGAAINWKIDCYNSGLIDNETWDFINIKTVAEMFARGQHPIIKDFGIKNKNL